MSFENNLDSSTNCGTSETAPLLVNLEDCSRDFSSVDSLPLNGPWMNRQPDVCINIQTPVMEYPINFKVLEEYYKNSNTHLSNEIASDDSEHFGAKENKKRFMVYSSDNIVRYSSSLEGLELNKKMFDSGFIWFDCVCPSRSDLEVLSQVFGIHALTTEDILVDETREKCEIFDGYYFISIRSFDPALGSPTFLEPASFFVIASQTFVLTFHFKIVGHIENVIRRMGILKDWIVYALIDDIIDMFFPTMRMIELEVDSVDDLVLILKESEAADLLRRMGNARRRVMMLHRLLFAKIDVVKNLIKRTALKNGSTTLYLTDIQDHIITMLQKVGHSEKTLARSYSNYLAQINIELSQSSHRTNTTAQRLTMLATFLVPMNLVTGLWGMNVKVPGQNEEAWFYAILCGMIIGLSCMYVYAKKKNLL